MSYFEEHYGKLSYPLGKPGFREAQLAAVQAVSAHFFANKSPAIVVMPTGAGKTAVATALAFSLRAKRVLVITPSRLLREQLSEKFESLVDLETIHAIPLMMPKPIVKNLRHRIQTKEEWKALRKFDVVVSTVYGITGLGNDVPAIPIDLFDLVIVDEGHHSPAATWAKALSNLESSKQILLTATPFRRDAREIKGRIVFSYDVRRAYDDGVFGDLTFRPVDVGSSESVDLAIARETEAQFLEDRQSGLEHLVMVRVDGLQRGRDLVKIYEQTNLKLKFVSGQTPLSTVRKTTAALRSGELDGIICVNMFGEGFDLPQLKIAALHSPHKSLAVTLQFIGRFARTTHEKIGRATFVAFPKEQRAELQELWTTSAIWPEIVHNVSSIRVEREQRAQEIFDTFEDGPTAEINDLPLYLLKPYFHAKIFKTFGDVNLNTRPHSTYERRLVFSSFSPEYNSLVLVRRFVRKPKWISENLVEDSNYHLDIIHYNEKSRMVFIGSTDKTITNYEYLVRMISDGRVSELPSATVNRALNDIEGLRFFNLGMRRKQFGSRSESYRTLAGPSADIAVSELDSQSYNRGHSFGKGRSNGEEVTIGISTSSKIWSNFVGQIPEYVEWCDKLAEKLTSRKAKPTGSGLDRLSAGQPIEEFPSEPVVGLLNSQTYLLPPKCFEGADGHYEEFALLTDFDIQIMNVTGSSVHFRLKQEGRTWDGIFRLADFPAVVPYDDGEIEFFVGRPDEPMHVSEYLSNHAPQFLLENFDMVEEATLFERVTVSEKFEPNDVNIFDWNAEKVNIEMEKPSGKEVKALSIFSWLSERLNSSGCSFVFNDDGAGEVADYISLEKVGQENVITLYHCKASASDKAGSRLADLYDVCGQAIRSGIWLSGRRLFEQLEHRLQKSKVVGIEKGNLEILRLAFSASERQKLRFEMTIVQPGISLSNLRERPEQLLVTTKHSAIAAGFDRFKIYASQ